MKKFLSIALIFILLFSLPACGTGAEEPSPSEKVAAQPQEEVPTSAPVETPSPEPVQTVAPPTPMPPPTPVPTPEPTPAPTSAPTPSPSSEPISDPKYEPVIMVPDDISVYDDIILTYMTAMLSGWDRQTCYDKGISIMTPCYEDYAYGHTKNTVLSYCYMDIDGNGSRELLIGSADVILCMYTQKDGAAELVFSGTERQYYFLEPDNLIVHYGSGGAGFHGYYLRNFKNAELSLKGAIIFDGYTNAEEPWFYSYTEEFDPAKSDKVSNATAEKWIAAYEGNAVYLPYQPFIA